jgi:hypothetical protein
MKKLNIKDVVNYVENNIGDFHQRRLDSISSLDLRKVLRRKNPYLFKAKNILTASEIVKNNLNSHLSSNEETIFGDWLEGLAIFINNKVYVGKKSGITGIDLEFDKDDVRYIVTIKSGPNWGNSRQIASMIKDFNTARQTLKTSNSKLHIEAVNGCCYGKDNKPYKSANYYKYCGQSFWEFVSGNNELYTEIIEPLGHKAKERNDEFEQLYAKTLNKFTLEFSQTFCFQDGSIDWKKLVEYNSKSKVK